MEDGAPEAPRRRGRRPAKFWASFTTEPEPYKKLSATCRHCHEPIRYHKKWEQARNHLMKCSPFLRSTEALPGSELPDWYVKELERRQKAIANRIYRGSNRVMRAGDAARRAPRQSTSPIVQIEANTRLLADAGNIEAVAATAVASPKPETAASSAVKVTNEDLKRLEDYVAMHLLLALPVEALAQQRVDSTYLTQAFHLCVRNMELPGAKLLLSTHLDRCYATVKRRVAKHLASVPVPVCLSLEISSASSKSELVMDYAVATATTGAQSFFLESMNFPSGAGATANAEWTAHGVARVLQTLSGSVAGCVTPSSSPESQQARQLLEQQFPSMHFHGCLQDALLSLVHDLFAPSTASSAGSSATQVFYPGLQEFALECTDLTAFLPKRKKLAYATDLQLRCEHPSSSGSRSGVLHVTPTRLITVEEGLSAILQAEAFLDVDSVSHQLFAATTVGHTGGDLGEPTLLQMKLREHVCSSQFTEKLNKYLAVLRPVHQLLTAFSDGTSSPKLPLSEVHPSFAKLAEQFNSSAVLLVQEKAALQVLVRQQYDRMLGSAHLLAYLLDPIFMGQDFTAKMKADVECKLLSCADAKGKPRTEKGKEELYMQYTDFQIVALHQKTNNADSFVYRMLKERKKSPLQYWLTDGVKWPELQAVACRIFSMPACAAGSHRLFAQADVAPSPLREHLDSRTIEKLAFVRANSRQLQLAEVGSSSQPLNLLDFGDESDPGDFTAFPTSMV